MEPHHQPISPNPHPERHPFSQRTLDSTSLLLNEYIDKDEQDSQSNVVVLRKKESKSNLNSCVP